MIIYSFWFASSWFCGRFQPLLLKRTVLPPSRATSVSGAGPCGRILRRFRTWRPLLAAIRSMTSGAIVLICNKSTPVRHFFDASPPTIRQTSLHFLAPKVPAPGTSAIGRNAGTSTADLSLPARREFSRRGKPSKTHGAPLGRGPIPGPPVISEETRRRIARVAMIWLRFLHVA